MTAMFEYYYSFLYYVLMKKLNFKEEDKIVDEMMAKKISEILEYRSIHIKDIADFVGKTFSAVSNWKRKVNKPYATDIFKIAQKARLDIRYFFDPDMRIKDADLDLKEIKQKEALFFFKRILFKNEEEYSEERSSLANEIIRLPEKKLKEVLRLLKIFKTEILEKIDIGQ